MPRFLFDVHDSNASSLGNEERACEGREDIEMHVRELLAQARDEQHAQDNASLVTSVIVHEVGKGVVMTAISGPKQDIGFIWSDTSPI